MFLLDVVMNLMLGFGGGEFLVRECLGAFSGSGSSEQKKGLLTIVPNSDRVTLLSLPLSL